MSEDSLEESLGKLGAALRSRTQYIIVRQRGRIWEAVDLGSIKRRRKFGKTKDDAVNRVLAKRARDNLKGTPWEPAGNVTLPGMKPAPTTPTQTQEERE